MTGQPWRDANRLRELYHEKGMSLREVGDELGCDQKTVRRWMDKKDIPTRPRRDGVVLARQNGPPRYVAEDSQGYSRSVSWYNGGRKTVKLHRLLAVVEYGFDAVPEGIVHHKNGKPWDNRLSNLELLASNAEHRKRHKRDRAAEPIRVDTNAILAVLDETGVNEAQEETDA